MHAALDLALAQHRVDRFADVVDRDDTDDRAGEPVDLHHLCGVSECSMDRGVRMVGVTQVLRPIDEVLADVVHLGLTSTGQGCETCLLHRSRRHERAARPGGLPEPELSSGVDDDIDPLRGDAQLLRCDLQRHRVHALAHLGPSVADLDPSGLVFDGGLESHDRPRQLAEPVAEAAVLESEPESDRVAVGPRCVIQRLHRVEAGLRTAATVVHDLTGPPHLTGVDDVAFPDLPPADADQGGQTVEHALHAELGLVGSEAAERATDGVVGAHGHGVYVDVGHPIRAARVAGRALEHLHPHTCVRSAVTDGSNLDGREVTFCVTSGPVLESDRMTLGMYPEALLPRQRALHRSIEEPCRERRVRLVAHVLLAAERAAVRHQRDGDRLVADREHPGDVVAVVPHALTA